MVFKNLFVLGLLSSKYSIIDITKKLLRIDKFVIKQSSQNRLLTK